MELSKYAQAIKNELSFSLEKAGSSIYELEESLKNINTGEGVYKTAFLGTKMVTDTAADVAKSLPELALKSTMAGGALGGLAFDEMDKSIVDLNKALDREREKITLVKRITSNLKREHGL
jgi:hypothetical protein